ncbi:hypothetical protein Hanom_Chr07g00660511 [Helianthus anomalus]
MNMLQTSTTCSINSFSDDCSDELASNNDLLLLHHFNQNPYASNFNNLLK